MLKVWEGKIPVVGNGSWVVFCVVRSCLAGATTSVTEVKIYESVMKRRRFFWVAVGEPDILPAQCSGVELDVGSLLLLLKGSPLHD